MNLNFIPNETLRYTNRYGNEYYYINGNGHGYGCLIEYSENMESKFGFGNGYGYRKGIGYQDSLKTWINLSI